LLDPDQRLPVHYHPNKSFAKQHLGLDHGKTEAWIILEAPAGSGVGLGFKEVQNKEDLLKLVRSQDSAALLASLRRAEVSVGDAILVPAGVAHAIDAGIFLLELQEPTDLSALLEWEGFAVDGIKDGHLGLGFETVTDALKLDPLTDGEFESLIARNALTGGALRSILPLKADGYFRAHLAPQSGEFEAGFAIALVLNGSGSVTFANAPAMEITQGDALVIPHAAGNYSISGANVIVCRPPLAELARVAI
jgi:mannose-6-phosphate isomerase